MERESAQAMEGESAKVIEGESGNSMEGESVQVMESERKLLLDILHLRVPARHVNEWLNDPLEDFQMAAEDPKHACRFSKFKRCDPLSFVVVLLNFLREDSAPILTFGERSQLTDQPSPTAKMQEGPGAKLSAPKMSPMKSFDISSAEEFPSLTTGAAAPRCPRVGLKQKRRIRPTPMNDSDKPIEGDITTVATNAAPTSSRMDDAAAGRLPICVQRSVYLYRSMPPVEVAGQPKRDEINMCENAPVLPGQPGFTLSNLTAQDEDEGYGDCAGDPAQLREATCGSTLIHATRLRQRYGLITHESAGEDSKEVFGRLENTPWSSSPAAPKTKNDTGDLVRVQESRADEVWLRPTACSASTVEFTVGNATSTNSRPFCPMASEACPRTPKCGQQNKPPDWRVEVPATPRSGSSTTPYIYTPTTEVPSWKEDPALAALASTYVYVMIKRLVPSLATEIHLTVRLLHARSDHNVARGVAYTHLVSERSAVAVTSAKSGKNVEQIKEENGSIGKGEKLGATVLFKTGMDCRSFAARVLLGLKSLLPHVGADMLTLLEGSLANAFETQDPSREARHALCQARVVGAKASRQSLDKGNPDDIAIVQSMGAPFAALQWHQHDSVNKCRTSTERALFQNRQDSVDRFGSLLRDYQASKKGLQQGAPSTVLHNLRTATLVLIRNLSPENLGWLARYFVAQLVGWGLAPPEETDSDLMALVAPAGEKGRANLQKLHRRISTPTGAEDGNASKSSQKIRLPRPQLGLARANNKQDRASHHEEDRGVGRSVSQVRSRKSAPGPRHRTEHPLGTSVRVSTAPLQLQWFPSNQEFFYHFLLVSDSHTFNVHLKAELAGEVTRLYEQHMVMKHVWNNKECSERDEDEDHEGTRATNLVAEGDSRIRNGVTGFTGTMLKLKVLAKFLGLLTFSPNWGVPYYNPVRESGGPSTLCDKAHCLLPLTEYLKQAWVTEGLVGAVPWMAEFLRMMKWDVVSVKTDFYKNILDTLANLHSQPCMRPEHPAFTEGLFAVSCELNREKNFTYLRSRLRIWSRVMGLTVPYRVSPLILQAESSSSVENLFQDLGSNLGVQGYRLSWSSNSVGPSELSSSTPPKSRVSQRLPNRRSMRPKPGSLDAEVVLTRRLIQNCCPFLEEVLTLIESLDRACKQGVPQGGEGTPRQPNPSIRIRGTTGVSPRSKRTIKPHPLKPLRVLYSVPQQQQKVDSVEIGPRNRSGNSQAQNTRLRLVETFFHSLPDEVQATADFVVRCAVRNACEETLATVVRPELATAMNMLHDSLGCLRKGRRPSRASDKLSADTFSRGINTEMEDHLKLKGLPERSRIHLEHKSSTVAALEQIVGPKARLIAGRKGHDIASTTTLSLVPQSFPLRVRETAAEIAGRHARHAAEKKIVEMMTATATDAELSYLKDAQREQRNEISQAGLLYPDKDDDGNGSGRKACKEACFFLLQDMHKSPALEVSTLLSALYSATREVDVCCRENPVEKTLTFQCGINDEGLVDAITSTVKETLRLAHKVRLGREIRVHSLKDIAVDCKTQGGGNARAIPSEASRASESSRIRKTRNSVMVFLTKLAKLWGIFYQAGECERKALVEAIRHSFSSLKELGNLFDDLLYLAALVWEDVKVEDLRKQSPGGEDGSIGGIQCLNMDCSKFEKEECPVWTPAMLLVTWGIVSPINAENALMSFIQFENTTNRHVDNFMAGSSQAARKDVVTALVKGYHIFFEESESPKVLPDISESKSQIGLDMMRLLRSYNPLNFCRLNVLLSIV